MLLASKTLGMLAVAGKCGFQTVSVNFHFVLTKMRKKQQRKVNMFVFFSVK